MANGRAASSGASARAKTSSGSDGSRRQAHSMIKRPLRRPDLLLGQPDLRELRGAQVRFIRAEEFVELRRLDRRAREHRVRLAAMVDLVLEEMREEPWRRLLLDAGTTRHGDRLGEVGIGQRGADGDKPAIDVMLRGGERSAVVERLLGLEEAAGL